MDNSGKFTWDSSTFDENESREKVGVLGVLGKEYPVYKGSNIIGRDPGICSIVLDLNTISRRHALLHIISRENLILMDLLSGNKTILFGVTLEPFIPYPVKNGNTFQLGDIFAIIMMIAPDDDLPLTQVLRGDELPAHKRIRLSMNTMRTSPNKNKPSHRCNYINSPVPANGEAPVYNFGTDDRISINEISCCQNIKVIPKLDDYDLFGEDEISDGDGANFIINTTTQDSTNLNETTDNPIAEIDDIINAKIKTMTSLEKTKTSQPAENKYIEYGVGTDLDERNINNSTKEVSQEIKVVQTLTENFGTPFIEPSLPVWHLNKPTALHTPGIKNLIRSSDKNQSSQKSDLDKKSDNNKIEKPLHKENNILNNNSTTQETVNKSKATEKANNNYVNSVISTNEQQSSISLICASTSAGEKKCVSFKNCKELDSHQDNKTDTSINNMGKACVLKENDGIISKSENNDGVKQQTISDRPVQRLIEIHEDTNQKNKDDKSEANNAPSVFSSNAKNSWITLVVADEGPAIAKHTYTESTNHVNRMSLPMYLDSHRILYTAFPHKLLKTELAKLGIETVTDLTQCTVVAADDMSCTFEFLCAVAMGLPIVGVIWAHICLRRKMIVDPWNYILQDPDREKRYNFNLKNTLRGRRNFLCGYNVSTTSGVRMRPSKLKSLVIYSGGIWQEGGTKWICVSTSRDKVLWAEIKQRGAKIVSINFILRGVLTQKLDIASHKLI